MSVATVQRSSVGASAQMQHTYAPRGSSLDLFSRRDREVLLSGPAGTGKSRACLEKLHLMCLMNPGMRGLIVRKTLASLAGSALDTWRKAVIPEALQAGHVEYYGGSSAEPAQYRYTNGSVVLLGGMDKASKIMSTEFDVIYVQEATELSEEDWQHLITRLRNGVVSFQQLLADCNPQAEFHWLYQRCLTGLTTLLNTRHEDNPRYFDRVEVVAPSADRDASEDDGKRVTFVPTNEGLAYLAGLDNLTGVWYQRLRLGKWVSAEGVVYSEFDASIHVIPRFEIPNTWTRYWSIDFGYTNPFVCQFWAEDPDGRLYLYRELYQTHTLVEDAAQAILNLVTVPDVGPMHPSGRKWIEPKPRYIVCDHDAEGRATLERHLRLGTTAAHKHVSDGIQAVESRLRLAGDGKPRLFLLRDSIVRRDPTLVGASKPTCTIEEFPSYVWDPRKEAPVKENDHGMDALRYLVFRLGRRTSTSLTLRRLS